MQSPGSRARQGPLVNYRDRRDEMTAIATKRKHGKQAMNTRICWIGCPPAGYCRQPDAAAPLGRRPAVPCPCGRGRRGATGHINPWQQSIVVQQALCPSASRPASQAAHIARCALPVWSGQEGGNWTYQPLAAINRGANKPSVPRHRIPPARLPTLPAAAAAAAAFQGSAQSCPSLATPACDRCVGLVGLVRLPTRLAARQHATMAALAGLAVPAALARVQTTSVRASGPHKPSARRGRHRGSLLPPCRHRDRCPQPAVHVWILLGAFIVPSTE